MPRSNRIVARPFPLVSLMIAFSGDYAHNQRSGDEAAYDRKQEILQLATNISRRGLLAAGAAASLAACCERTAPAAEPVRKSKVAMIHVTDLFRPHADPDDHWDLACVYSLAQRGDVDLLAVAIDYPPQAGLDPDVQAVAQMNYLTGLSVPVVVGSPRRFDPSEIDRPENKTSLGGVNAIVKILRDASQPVVINILGSSRDVALAGRLYPTLFADKCAGVYLNAGSGTRDKALAGRLEYNVILDPVSYAGIFELPCPVYWMPCFEVEPGPHGEPLVAGPYGTYYRFKQKEVLPHLSARARNYFAFVFKQSEESRMAENEAPPTLRSNWLHYLEGPNDAALLTQEGQRYRNMWCTGGFLHAAGYGVESDGRIAPQKELKSPLFTFDPVRVGCNAQGITTWTPATSGHQFIFHVRDEARYPVAMTAAMRSLLHTLP
jgi:hypothetical protein